jgi:hypothetical protein
MANFFDKIPRTQARGFSPQRANDGSDQVGAAIQEFGTRGIGAVEAGVIDLRDEADGVSAQDGMNKANQEILDLQDGRAKGTNGPEDKGDVGYNNLKQNASLLEEKGYSDKIDKAIQSALDGAPNDRIRKMMSPLENLRLQTKKHLSGWNRTQRDAYNNTVLLTTVVTASKMAVSKARQGPEQYDAIFKPDGSLDDVVAGVKLYWSRQGVDADTVAVKVEAATTAIHTEVIEALLKDGQDVDAEEYLRRVTKSRFGKMLDSKQAAVLGNLIRMDQVQSKANKAVAAQADGVDLSDPDVAENALKQLEKSLSSPKDTKALEAAKTGLLQKIKQATTFKRMRNDQRFDDLSEKAASNGGTEIKQSEMSGLSQREKKYLAWVTQEAVDDKFDPDRKRRGDGKTFGLYLTDVRDESKFGNLSFKDLKLKYEAGVTKEQWDKTIRVAWSAIGRNKHRADAARDEAAAKPKPDPTMGTSDLRRIELGANAADVDMKDDDEYSAWQREYSRRVDAQRATTAVEYQAIINRMIVERVSEKIITDRGFGLLDPDKQTSFLLSRDERLEMAQQSSRGEVGDEGHDKVRIEPWDHERFVAHYDDIVTGLRMKGRQEGKNLVTRANILHTFDRSYARTSNGTKKHRVKK